MGFLHLLICDFRLIEYQSNKTACNSFFFHPELELFVLDFNVDHSKPMRLSFCHVLSWFANTTNSKPNNLSNLQVELLEQTDRLGKPNFSFVYLIILSIMYSLFEFPLFLHIFLLKKMHSMILFQLTYKIVIFLLVPCFVINFLIMITLASFCRLCFTLGRPYYP